jgi:transposase, IS30 family
MRGERPISEPPAGAENRSQASHLERDTVIGSFNRHCNLTMLDRKTGYAMIGKLYGCTTAATNRGCPDPENPPHRYVLAHVDNGTDFHGYNVLERATGPPSPRLTTPGNAAPAKTRTH